MSRSLPAEPAEWADSPTIPAWLAANSIRIGVDTALRLAAGPLAEAGADPGRLGVTLRMIEEPVRGDLDLDYLFTGSNGALVRVNARTGSVAARRAKRLRGTL